MMLTAIAALIRSLPRIFDWGLAPVSVVLLLMAFWQRTRPGASSGFTAVAAISMLLLTIAAGFVAYVGWRFRDVVLDLLLNSGPLVTLKFLTTSLLRGAGVQPADFLPMAGTTAGASIAAVALRWVADRGKQPRPMSGELTEKHRAAGVSR
jgi:predicted membrane protein